MLKFARKAFKRALLGATEIPQQCTIPMHDPQSEVEVWLHGLGSPLNVTRSHMVACAAPSIVGVGLDAQPGTLLVLKFHAGGANGPLLGQLGLQASAVLRTPGAALSLCDVRGSDNYCLPRRRYWGYALFQAWLRARNKTDADVPITPREANAMSVLFSCPRPIVLVSAAWGESGNMFPMNLMGPIGNGGFAFALNSRRQAAAAVQRAGRVALSGIPFEQAALARQLGKNHRRESVPWSELPFPTIRSAALGIPVPAFATRVREMEIEAIRNLGSHTLFVARILHDQRYSDTPQFFMIHGLYHAFRQKHDLPPNCLPDAGYPGS